MNEEIKRIEDSKKFNRNLMNAYFILIVIIVGFISFVIANFSNSAFIGGLMGIIAGVIMVNWLANAYIKANDGLDEYKKIIERNITFYKKLSEMEEEQRYYHSLTFEEKTEYLENMKKEKVE